MLFSTQTFVHRIIDFARQLEVQNLYLTSILNHRATPFTRAIIMRANYSNLIF
ncbi:hypothetical protein BDR05DRAFT_387607 [Suillus weaverae]|nr:hypothetical protein BDR05DRAFT_387607 [Suillus weaverae]